MLSWRFMGLVEKRVLKAEGIVDPRVSGQAAEIEVQKFAA
jgi:hypothetical protein